MIRTTILKTILRSRKTMTMRSRSLAELTQLIEQAATLSRARGLSGFVKVTVGHGVRGDPATRSGKRSHETLERELPRGPRGLHGSFGRRTTPGG
jgi:hypothetical protein